MHKFWADTLGRTQEFYLLRVKCAGLALRASTTVVSATMNTTQKFDVIVCGSLHLDIVVRAPGMPRVDETVVGHGWQQLCGGKGGNQAVQAARHGARTAMIGRIGKDGFGESLMNNLIAADVHSDAVRVDSTKSSGMSVAIQQDDGEYGAVIVSAANLEMDPERLAEDWVKLGGARVLVLQNEIPHAANVAAAKVARSNGAQVILNAAPARTLTSDLSDNVDVLVVNRVEAEMISGMTVIDRRTAVDAMSTLSSDARAVVITLGGNGLVVKNKSEPAVEIEALQVKVTSTHGAGDCFVGVLAACLAKGSDLLDACRIANESAAAFVSRRQ
jgi:ribokinase